MASLRLSEGSDQERGWEGKEGESGKMQPVKFKEKKEILLGLDKKSIIKNENLVGVPVFSF